MQADKISFTGFYANYKMRRALQCYLKGNLVRKASVYKGFSLVPAGKSYSLQTPEEILGKTKTFEASVDKFVTKKPNRASLKVVKDINACCGRRFSFKDGDNPLLVNVLGQVNATFQNITDKLTRFALANKF